MCKGLSYLPSSCLEKAKGMRVKLSHLTETHKAKAVDGKTPLDLETLLSNKRLCRTALSVNELPKKTRNAPGTLVVITQTFVQKEKYTLHAFRCFLRSEFSEENLDFWLACEDYRVSPSNVQKSRACGIYNQFINPDAQQEVNLDAETRDSLLSVMDSPNSDTFNTAQQRIFNLMAKDSFPRFLRSTHCTDSTRAY